MRAVPARSTMTCTELLAPTAVAVIVAVPAEAVVTFPESETTATAGLSLDHTTVRNTRCPAASQSWTASCTVAPSNRVRSEERRVGKERRARQGACDTRKPRVRIEG